MGEDRAKESVAEIAQRLEQAWQTGDCPELSRFVPPAGVPERTDMLVRLVKVDQQYRWRSDAPSRLEAYLEQWPELQDNVDVVSELLQSECRIRTELGDKPSQEELLQRFPTLFEHVDLRTVADGSQGGVAESSDPDNAAALPIRSSFDTTPISGDSQPTPHPSWRVSPTGGRVGRYEIRALIGAGGMGEVYRAYDAELQREVALKIPRVLPGANPEVLGRFVQEALAAASLRHPNICPVYDAGQIEDRYYIVMAMIEGNNLADELKAGEVGVDRAVRITAQLARALETAHGKGIIHRDIKPANVLIDRSDQPLLTDFGLAHRVDEKGQQTAEGSFLGTPAYMSPEQAELKPLDHRTDIYSLGVVLYQLLSGRLPYPGPPSQFLQQIVKGQVPRLRTHNADLDPRLESVCHKALARDPRDRYQTAAELAAALEAFAQPSIAAAGRGKQLLWVVAVGVLLLALVPVASWLTTGRNRSGRDDGGGSTSTSSMSSEPARPKVPEPLTPREQEMAAVQAQIDRLAPAGPIIQEVRDLETEYCESRNSIFGMNSPVVSRKVATVLAKLRTCSLSEKESEIAGKADEVLANTSIFAVPEESYLFVRQVAEMLDARIAGLHSHLAMLEAHAFALEEDSPDEQLGTSEERDWRVRETRRQLAGLAGVDLVAADLGEMDAKASEVRSEMFPKDGVKIAISTHILLARIYALELTEHEIALHDKALEAPTKLGAFSRSEDVFAPAMAAVHAVYCRRQLLRDKLNRLNSWTPDSNDYESLIEMRPRVMQFDVDRARLLAVYNRHDEALEILGQLISAAPGDIVLRTLRARVYIHARERQAARREVNRIIASDSQAAYGHYLSGYLHLENGRFEDAIAACSAALKLQSDLVPALLSRARAYCKIGTFSLALADADKALRAAPWSAEVYEVRTLAQVGLEDYDKAYEDALQARQLEPLSVEGHYVLAQVLFHKQQYEEAGQQLTMAILKDSNVVDYYRLRAECADKLGWHLTAAGDRARVLQLEKEESDSR